ncbi:FAD binding domain-containing protein [Crucibulum laeve]|uniref:FAD binding domain-containing protein n=1 Tax=Crucibulum laeve TaxID=68775 RepID=A0A5C3M0Y5_9AGAR|nr:FAD binding domain-containing protein [Crucibulum laeve]
MAAMAQLDPILVVGAGPSGLVLALVLAKSGVPVRIIEKSSTIPIGTRGSVLMPRTIEIYNLLGLHPQLSASKGLKDPPMVIYNTPGGNEVLKTAPPMLKELPKTPDIPFNAPIFISQNINQHILREELEKHGCKVEYNTELISFQQDDNGLNAHVQRMSDGVSVAEDIRASFLVGADGGKGSTADSEGMIVANATVKNLAEKVSHIWKTPTADGILPYDVEARKFLIAIIGSSLSLEDKCSPEGVRDLLRTQIGRQDIAPNEYEWLSFFKPNIRMVERFSVGRVFLCGDAAHVHSPHGGQGLNSSVQDSFNLAWKLVLVQKGVSPLSLLETYNEERLPVITEMLRQVTGIHKDSSGEGGNLTLERGPHLMMMGINYRWSSIVLDDQFSSRDEREIEELKKHAYIVKDAVLRAGDRAPDTSDLLEVQRQDRHQTPATLFSLLLPDKHTVLIFIGNRSFSEGMRLKESLLDESTLSYHQEFIQVFLVGNLFPSAALEAPKMGTVCLFDSKAFAYQLYSASDAESMKIIVIRPDGVIGAILRDAGGLRKYFSKMFSTAVE